MECLVTPLVPIVPLVPMDERNPTVLNLIHEKNILSALNEIGTNGRTESHRTQPDPLGKYTKFPYEMHFTNGVPMECQVTPLVPMGDLNPTVLNLTH